MDFAETDSKNRSKSPNIPVRSSYNRGMSSEEFKSRRSQSIKMTKTNMTLNIKSNLGKFYRVEGGDAPQDPITPDGNNHDLRDDEIWRLKCKNYAFLAVDFVLFVTCSFFIGLWWHSLTVDCHVK